MTTAKQNEVVNLTKEQITFFNEMYANHYKSVLNHVRISTNNCSNSEDITSDVFVKAYRFLSLYDNTFAVSTWLRKITNNTIIDFYRANKYNASNVNISDFINSEGDEYFQVEADNDSASNVEDSELINEVSKAFASLKPKYQKIATLFFLEEKKYNEIAEICDMPMGSVKGMINRCRAMLQSELKGAKMQYTMA